MTEQCWLNDSTISFPLAAATKLITGDDTATPNQGIVYGTFRDLGIKKLSFGTNGFVTLDNAVSHEWINERWITQLLTTLAPIIPDAAYVELESTSIENDSRLYRLIIAGDTVVADYPTLTWDCPQQIAATATTALR